MAFVPTPVVSKIVKYKSLSITWESNDLELLKFHSKADVTQIDHLPTAMCIFCYTIVLTVYTLISLGKYQDDFEQVAPHNYSKLLTKHQNCLCSFYFSLGELP